MAIDPMTASAAYRAASTGESAFKTGQNMAGPESTGSTFGDLVRDTVQGAIDSNRVAEETSARGLAGQANVTEVVTAIADAEATLSTVVAVRDRVISAYQEILRMPI
jgi:flagellar hook-basal body complex protein FliE